MRDRERDLLLLVLAVSAGSADGWSYFGLGHAFVANMTGNTVLVGISVFGPTHDLLHPAISIGCYVPGVMFAAILTRPVSRQSAWSRRISAALFLESILLIGAEIAWAVFSSTARQNPYSVPPDHNAILGVVAFAIGMQSGAMLQLRIPGVVTTYITGTWTSLTSGLVRLASGKSLPERGNLSFEERLLLQGGVLISYFASALLAGWVLKVQPAAAGAIPASAVLIVAVFGLVRGGQATESSPV